MNKDSKQGKLKKRYCPNCGRQFLMELDTVPIVRKIWKNKLPLVYAIN